METKWILDARNNFKGDMLYIYKCCIFACYLKKDKFLLSLFVHTFELIVYVRPQIPTDQKLGIVSHTNRDFNRKRMCNIKYRKAFYITLQLYPNQNQYMNDKERRNQ